MLRSNNRYKFYEESYNMEDEPLNAALFTTGNGYIGIRGSFEEFGSLRIQGGYIRGLFDEIYEIIEPFADNVYMKKYYLDEDKLKNFEKQDSIINFGDILLLRISIGGETFYPWEGKILSWERYIDMSRECLVRNVTWENTKGHITTIHFERFSSFDNDHIYCIKADIIPENHNEMVRILSGIDTRVKTGGQKITKVLDKKVIDNKAFLNNKLGEKYNYEVGVSTCSNVYENNKKINDNWQQVDDNGILANALEFKVQQEATYRVEKVVYTISSRESKDVA